MRAIINIISAECEQGDVMIDADVVGDLEGRDLIWLVVLGNALRGPVALGVLVSRLEALVLRDLGGSPRHISRCLHEMTRGGHIRLAHECGRWRVSVEPKGRGTFQRLMDARPPEHSLSLGGVALRVRTGFADLAAAAA